MHNVSPGERLTDIILSNRMTKKEFSIALGYNPSYITQICRNTKPPSQEFASKVEKAFGVPADWLLYGREVKKGDYDSNTKDALLNKVSHMSSDEDLHAVLAFINCLDEIPDRRRARQVKLNDSPRMFTIPIKGEVAGGSPITAYEMYDETIESPIKADSALYLKGESMEPDYPDGSVLLIKENAYISNGDVVVALIMREAEVAEATCKIINKRRNGVQLIPINPDYETQTFGPSSGCEIKIFGKVVGKI